MMYFTVFLLFSISVFLFRSEWEKLQLRKEYYELVSPKRLKEGKIRIVFFSDLHHYLPADLLREKILKAINEEKPDAVLIGGDMLCMGKKKNRHTGTDTALSLIRELCREYPVYYAPGNHEERLRLLGNEDFNAYLAGVRECGAVYLSDSEAPVSESVSVSGVSLPYRYYEKLFPGINKKTPLEPGFFEEKSVFTDRERFNIALVHSPHYYKEAVSAGADLVLSGHDHGGTVRLPGGTGLMTPQFQFFSGESSGLHKYNGAYMIATRGLGTHSIRIRINDLPELSVIDIVDNDRKAQLQA